MEAEWAVVFLHELSDADRPKAGAKALSLARMIRGRLPVPPGFCVLGRAYREHLASSGLQPLISATLDELAGAPAERRRTLLSDLRRAIAEAPMSPELGAEIEAQYRRLKGGRVAVRSSATAEDLPGHSFAGQHETFLGVAGIEDCLRAVAGCWASLWTDRAVAYREQSGFGHLATDMAVIVQEMVPAEAAGVVFTADPVSGRRDRLVVEGCLGLGEALVSGRVRPDRFDLTRPKLRVVATALAAKAIERIAGDDGIEERAVAGGRASRPCLDARRLRRLGRLALEAERLFGGPQDIEWAASRGRLFLLQSRPITALPPEPSPEDRQIWTNANIGEVLPDVASPMTWSLVAVFLDAIFGVLFEKMGMDLREVALTRLIAGRAYFNLNTFAAMLRCLPGMRKADLTEVFGGAQGRLLSAQGIQLAEDDLPNLHFSTLRLAWRLPGLFFWFLAHSPMRVLPVFERFRRQTDEVLRLDPSALPEAELVALLHRTLPEMLDLPGGVAAAGVGIGYLSQLSKICRAWLGDRDGTLANRLLAGVGGVDSAEAGLALWRLAASAHESPEVEAILLSGEPFAGARQRLAETSGGRAFLAEWDGFMARHGHHTRGEVDVMNPRWAETPDAILDQVRGYLRAMGRVDPVALHRQRGVEREALARECSRRLGPLKRWLFRFVLVRAQRGCAFRESLKSEAVRRLAVLRRMLVELGTRLARRGVLAGGADIFFLRFEELAPVVRGEAGFEVRATVAERRAEHERDLTLSPPAVVVGRFDPGGFVPDEVALDADVLTGLAVSPGVARGPARVVLRSDTAERVLPGEILVAPFTDPGWTPYFLPAAGIVVDLGGQLSHGSIIAREYGIPAVVNVGPATKILRTGQWVEVDGDRGLVRILRETGPAEPAR